MNTRSAFLKAPWELDIRQVSLPDHPPPGELLLKVEACGLGGSDLRAAEAEARDWTPFGHEIAASVLEAGEGCERFYPGQKVVLESSTFCGECPACRNGRVRLCERPRHFWGRPALGFSDFMLVPAYSAVPYDDLTAETACLAEPAGVAYDLVKTAEVELGDSVCVAGPGPIGLMAVALALKNGARVTCLGTSLNSRRLAAASGLGAQTVFLEDLPQRDELYGSFDKVLSTVPASHLGESLPLLARGGTLAFVGFDLGDPKVEIDVNEFHMRRLQIRACFPSPGVYLPAVLELLKDGSLPSEKLISHIFPLRDLEKALNLCRTEKDATLKVVIKP